MIHDDIGTVSYDDLVNHVGCYRGRRGQGGVGTSHCTNLTRSLSAATARILMPPPTLLESPAGGACVR